MMGQLWLPIVFHVDSGLCYHLEHAAYDPRGQRKYLTPLERDAFLRAALASAPERSTFCAAESTLVG